jgi:SAM-dependent methyltransferase
VAISRSKGASKALARRVAQTLGKIGQPDPSGAGPTTQRAFSFPSDVADPVALKALLRETDLFGAATAEAEGYLNDALDRFRITMALIPDLPSGARVLELGANPYFLTRLLRARGLSVTAANWFGERSGFGRQGQQDVMESGQPTTYVFDHFNIESEPFPYADGDFDLVLFCEILEHLPSDPIHTLAEIHRVLKPGGVLLLTTPNAIRLENLQRMMRGDNVYEQLSGYGTYGRHNREYTVDELRTLLTECGYDVSDVFAADIGHPPSAAPADQYASAADRGENLFALARAGDGPRWPYPSWLYSSQHALRRIVRPGVVMGRNCELQTSGFHVLETLHGRSGRWTSGSPATLSLEKPDAEPCRLVIEGATPPAGACGSISLVARLGQQELRWDLPCDDSTFTVDGEVKAEAGPIELTVTTDPTWHPADVGLGSDGRQLGVVIFAARFEPSTA